MASEGAGKLLATLPPRISFDCYRSVVAALVGHLATKQAVTLDELKHDGRVAPCGKFLEETVDALVDAGALQVEGDCYLQSETLQKLWNLIRSPRLDSIVLWGLYHLASSAGPGSFTVGELREVCTNDRLLTEDDLDSATVAVPSGKVDPNGVPQVKQVKPLKKVGNKWKAASLVIAPPRQALLTSELDGKVKGAAAALRESGESLAFNEFLGRIQDLQEEEILRVLGRRKIVVQDGEVKLSDEDVKHVSQLVAEVEGPLRLGKDVVLEMMIDLFDTGAYSFSELEQILREALARDVSSSVSRGLKRLRSDRLVALAYSGSYGRDFYTTNCDNCPFGIGNAKCREASIGEIVRWTQETQKPLGTGAFNGFSNQTLRTFASKLRLVRHQGRSRPEIGEYERLSQLVFQDTVKQFEQDSLKADKLRTKYGKATLKLDEKDYPVFPDFLFGLRAGRKLKR